MTAAGTLSRCAIGIALVKLTAGCEISLDIQLTHRWYRRWKGNKQGTVLEPHLWKFIEF